MPKYNLQPADDSPSNEGLDPSHDGEHRYGNPYQFPVPPLDYARPERCNQMYTADKEKRPVHGEAQDVARIVEVERLRRAWWERPVERREGRGGVPQRG